MAITVALLGTGGGTSTAQASPSAPSQSGAGGLGWCEFIPPEWRWVFPECQGEGSGGEESAPVEEHYAGSGSWDVSTLMAEAPGTPGVLIHYPTDLGEDGYEHPILVYGNGTGVGCDDTSSIHEPFAAWGFVVICPDSGSVGSGDEMLAAVEWMVQQDGNSDSVFFEVLDTDNVGAYGGSQGAGGSVWATLKSNGLIDSTLPLVLPDPIWACPIPLPEYCNEVPDLGQLQAPVFFAWGADDFLSLSRVNDSYNPTSPPKVMADMVGVGHDTPLDRVPYMIAWFKYTLEGDDFARSAFVATDGNPPEIATNSSWAGYQSQGLS